MKTVLVTGGAGFIGSHLCERLVRGLSAQAGGYRVISLDNYFTGTRDNYIDGIDYREGHTKDIEKHVPETPDIIYHMGEYARVLKSLEEPEKVWDMNVAGTLATLEFWRKRGGKLVYAGSSTKTAPTRADGTAGKDLAPYTWAKAAMCDVVNDYGRWYELPYAITYFYNVYGSRERSRENHGTFIETFRQNYLHGRPHEVASPGTQTRAFTHVADTVSGIVLVGEKGEGDGFCIGAQEVYSLLDVAKMFGGEIVMTPQTKSTRTSGAENITKMRELGWEQKHTLPEYIAEVKREKH